MNKENVKLREDENYVITADGGLLIVGNGLVIQEVVTKVFKFPKNRIYMLKEHFTRWKTAFELHHKLYDNVFIRKVEIGKVKEDEY